MFGFQEKEKTIPQSQIKQPSPQEKMTKVHSQEFSPNTLENTDNYAPTPQQIDQTDFQPPTPQQVFKAPSLSSNQKLRKKVLKIKQKAEKLQEKSTKNSDSFMQFLGYCSLFLDQPDDYFMPDLLNFLFQYCDKMINSKDKNIDDCPYRKRVLAIQLKEVITMQMAPMTANQRLALLPHTTEMGRAVLNEEEKELADKGDRFLTEDLYFTDDHKFVNDRLKNPDEYKSIYLELSQDKKEVGSFNKSVNEKIQELNPAGRAIIHIGNKKPLEPIVLSRLTAEIKDQKIFRDSLEKDQREGKRPEETEIYKMFADLNCGQEYFDKNPESFYVELLDWTIDEKAKDKYDSSKERNKQGLLKLKDMQYNQMLHVVNTYGKFLVGMHPLDLVSRSETKFTAEFGFSQNCEQMIVNFPEIFDLGKPKDRQYIALSNYLGSFLAGFLGGYYGSFIEEITDASDKSGKNVEDLLGKDLKSIKQVPRKKDEYETDFNGKKKLTNSSFSLGQANKTLTEMSYTAKIVEQEGISLKGFNSDQQKQYNASLKRRGIDTEINLLDENKAPETRFQYAEFIARFIRISKKIFKTNETNEIPKKPIKSSPEWNNLVFQTNLVIGYLVTLSLVEPELSQEYLKNINSCIYKISKITDDKYTEKRNIAIQLRVLLTPYFEKLGFDLNSMDDQMGVNVKKADEV